MTDERLENLMKMRDARVKRLEAVRAAPPDNEIRPPTKPKKKKSKKKTTKKSKK